MISKKLLLPFAGLLTSLSMLLTTACNEDSSDTPYYVVPSSVAVNGFSIKPDSKVLTGLDSVFFSIDLERGLIFNADSLPKGTNVSALIPIISLPSSVAKATIVMDGGTHRTGEVDYLKNSSDSIDFTGRVALELTSSEGNSRVYQVKVNVHTMEPDSLWWGNTAISRLPSRLANPRGQRTVPATDAGVASVIAESDGTYTFATCADPFGDVWSKRELSLPFIPDVRSFTCCGDSYYMLSDKGQLYVADASGLTYSNVGVEAAWDCIVGAYGTTLIGMAGTGTQRHFVSWPEGAVAGSVPDGFPTDGFSSLMTVNSKWWDTPLGLLYGGTDVQGNVISAVWAFDGTSWADISNGGLPALSGAVMVPYFAYRRTDKSWVFNEYSVLMVLGGRDADGNLNRSMYVSYDNGVFWNKASDLMQMPEYIPGMYDLDAIVASTRMSGNFEPKGWTQTTTPDLPSWYKVNYVTDGYDVEWMCPYIYLYGGRDSAGHLYDTVWRGVIRRLTFMPLI